MSYAKGKYAFGFCDKTGFRYPLRDLVPEFNNGVRTGFLVGRDVADPDQPQNFLGRVKIFDPQSRNNRDKSVITNRINQNNNYSIRKSTITNNTGTGLSIYGDAHASVNQTNIFNNSGLGIQNTSANTTINAQQNWWGDASGAPHRA